ncbi:DUF4248 domain-containing protein [Bacteroides graminisolvens]|jgi:hypothetical protein|uniref:DUF4248 domain-containing protein n=1 Tax=Bacteroides graminisolvens TaxID=477666 RepID=UPI0029C6E66A|nr:DUF4248 domain-containing protein [Bacteroides graminisolvens]
METEEPFRIKAYYKADLAMLYNPDMLLASSMRKLRNWIQKNEDLYRQMYEGNEGKNDHCYTRRQVELIVSYLGEP